MRDATNDVSGGQPSADGAAAIAPDEVLAGGTHDGEEGGRRRPSR